MVVDKNKFSAYEFIFLLLFYSFFTSNVFLNLYEINITTIHFPFTPAFIGSAFLLAGVEFIQILFEIYNIIAQRKNIDFSLAVSILNILRSALFCSLGLISGFYLIGLPGAVGTNIEIVFTGFANPLILTVGLLVAAIAAWVDYRNTPNFTELQGKFNFAILISTAALIAIGSFLISQVLPLIIASITISALLGPIGLAVATVPIIAASIAHYLNQQKTTTQQNFNLDINSTVEKKSLLQSVSETPQVTPKTTACLNAYTNEKEYLNTMVDMLVRDVGPELIKEQDYTPYIEKSWSGITGQNKVSQEDLDFLKTPLSNLNLNQQSNPSDSSKSSPEIDPTLQEGHVIKISNLSDNSKFINFLDLKGEGSSFSLTGNVLLNKLGALKDSSPNITLAQALSSLLYNANIEATVTMIFTVIISNVSSKSSSNISNYYVIYFAKKMIDFLSHYQGNLHTIQQSSDYIPYINAMYSLVKACITKLNKLKKPADDAKIALENDAKIALENILEEYAYNIFLLIFTAGGFSTNQETFQELLDKNESALNLNERSNYLETVLGYYDKTSVLITTYVAFASLDSSDVSPNSSDVSPEKTSQQNQSFKIFKNFAYIINEACASESLSNVTTLSKQAFYNFITQLRNREKPLKLPPGCFNNINRNNQFFKHVKKIPDNDEEAGINSPIINAVTSLTEACVTHGENAELTDLLQTFADDIFLLIFTAEQYTTDRNSFERLLYGDHCILDRLERLAALANILNDSNPSLDNSAQPLPLSNS
jgi:hypothetical protein